ncbi:MAG: VOC family protein [Candidatus Moraniibacteriota bacterium]|nr:MAG: VOC family protein [Candidatus Moranbacteria bacterium]
MKIIYPVTVTSKLNESKAFYQEVFGFHVVFEADWYVQLLHEASGIEIGLMKPNLESQSHQLHEEFPGKGIIYSFEVEDAAQEYEKIKKTSTHIFYPLITEEWGQIHFMLKDPAGVTIDVVQQAKEQ